MTLPERPHPSRTADERAMLDGWLDFHRATLAAKCAGLTPDQLRTPTTPPSELTLLGLVRHLAEVERGWFRRGVAQEADAAPIWVTDDEDAEFHVEGAEADLAFRVWEEEIARARAIVAAAPDLDVTFESHRGPVSLRWVMVHMVEEYARHNGHADLLREAVDGSTGY